MAAIAAHNAYLSFNSQDLSAYLTNQGLQRGAATEDTTHYGSTAEEFTPTILQSAGLDLEGVWDATVAGYLDPNLATAKAFVFGPAGNTTGNVKYSGTAILDKLNIMAPVKNVIRFSAHLKPSGAITVGTF